MTTDDAEVMMERVRGLVEIGRGMGTDGDPEELGALFEALSCILDYYELPEKARR